jgi:hypothetical protein
MPRAVDEDRKPPPPEAWKHAPRLVPALVPAEPALISDGGGLPFAPSAAFQPFEPLEADDPAVQALVAQIDRGRRKAQPKRLFRARGVASLETADKLKGWRALARTDDEVLFGRGRPPHLLTVAVRQARRGRWEPMGVSNSRPLRAMRDGARASSWRLDPSFPASPDARELPVLITEQTMASGARAADRLLTPELHLDGERALVRVYVKPIEGYVGRSSRHETPVIVELPEPLGVRRVVDGALYEPPLG